MCGLGYMLSIMGTLLLAKGYSDKNVRAFAELYIAGNVVAILATVIFFLVNRRHSVFSLPCVCSSSHSSS